MNRTALTPLLTIVGVASLLGLSACSSDNKLSIGKSSQSATTVDGSSNSAANSGDSSGDGTGTAGSTASGDDTSPSLAGIPGIAGDCTSYLSAFAGAISGQNTDLGGLSTLFDSLQGKVPKDVESAVKVLSKDFGLLQALYAKYNNDFSKAAADPAFTTLFSDSGFSSASATFNQWISSGCPTS
ncbi:MAG: hypothetical protein JWL72_398 [Ilumatobacteraceae bacterium]|nr:hypothetical protein [Ilumatobacteraceae bacterium]